MNRVARVWNSLNWRVLAPGVAVLLATLWLFSGTLRAMVNVWNTSETYTHAYLVLPIVVWLVWRQRASLAAVPLRSAPWLLLPMAAVAFLWLVGELSSAQALTHFALVTLLVLSVPAIFGLRLANALLFPLMFMFFAVPVGDFLVPQMMDWTADFTVAALQFTGVPVYREGLQFVIPSGSWSVVSACSGVRYLIASFMVGTLFAYLNFQSGRKRALFILVSLLVPLVANWFRAYLIVMLGHLSNNRLAAGVDHLVYGWVFFGVVIGLMFWIGSRWADPPQAEADPKPSTQSAASSSGNAAKSAVFPWLVALAAIVVMGLAPLAFWQLNRGTAIPVAEFKLGQTMGPDWSAQSTPISDWVPSFKNAKAVATQSYAGGTASVAVWLGYYRNQTYETKLLTSTNAMTEVGLETGWVSTRGDYRNAAAPGLNVQVRTAQLRAPLHSAASVKQKLRAWQVYWIGGRFVANETRARLQLSLNRLLGQSDDAAVIIFYTDEAESSDHAKADSRLEAFVAAALPTITAQLEATRSKP